MAEDRKAVEGAIDEAIINATTEPNTRQGAAGYIQGVAVDYYAGRLQRTGSRLGAKGYLIEKILDGGPPTTNMAAWFKYGVGITVTGLGVSQWSDQSGNGRHLLQGTDADRPSLQSDNSILADGTSEALSTSSFTLNQPMTWYVLAKQVTSKANGGLIGDSASNNAFIYQTNVGGTIAQALPTGGVNANAGLALNTWGVIAAVANGASSSLAVNTNAPVTGNPGANGFTNGFSVFKFNIFFGNWQVKEVILYSAAHDATTQAQVIRYLQAVGGI